MRYIIQPPENGKPLAWLLSKDPMPSAAPLFPDSQKGLVVAYLLNGACYAEVIPKKEQLTAVCGSGFPFGRLFFHVKKDDLFQACPRLSVDSFGG
jgi:hypothetical protein